MLQGDNACIIAYVGSIVSHILIYREVPYLGRDERNRSGVA